MWFVLFAILVLELVLGVLIYNWADRGMRAFQHAVDVFFGPPGYR